MRVIAGQLGGRLFESPTGHKTHPMSEKIRGALFNTLGDIAGLNVLDAFSGSGAISFEAMSRGARSSLAIESDPKAQQAIRRNKKALKLSRQVTLISASLAAWMSTTSNVFFDIIVCDPPYDDIQLSAISCLSEYVSETGTIICSLPLVQPIDFQTSMTLVATKLYGDAVLQFYKKPK